MHSALSPPCAVETPTATCLHQIEFVLISLLLLWRPTPTVACLLAIALSSGLLSALTVTSLLHIMIKFTGTSVVSPPSAVETPTIACLFEIELASVVSPPLKFLWRLQLSLAVLMLMLALLAVVKRSSSSSFCNSALSLAIRQCFLFALSIVFTWNLSLNS